LRRALASDVRTGHGRKFAGESWTLAPDRDGLEGLWSQMRRPHKFIVVVLLPHWEKQ
jgi:hypothetical protein